jgi:hypothetical protein
VTSGRARHRLAQQTSGRWRSSASCVRRSSSHAPRPVHGGPLLQWRLPVPCSGRLGGGAWGTGGAGKARRGRQCWLVAGRRVLAGQAGRWRGRSVIGRDQAGRRQSLPHMQDFLFSPFCFYYLGYRGGLYVREK